MTNQGGSAVQSFYGPLNVDLSWAMGMLQLSSLPAVNAVVNASEFTGALIRCCRCCWALVARVQENQGDQVDSRV